MLTAIAAIVVFGILIFIHEAGHFFVARLVGVGVHEFSLGFGPRLWGFAKGKTAYTLRAVPLGGFVRLVGMDPQDEEKDQPYSFARKSVWQRMAVILAGPVMNFVLAIFVLAFVFIFQGLPTATTTVNQVIPGYPAATAGIKVGDRIVAIDGEPVRDWSDILWSVGEQKAGDTRILTVERDGRRLTFEVTPVQEEGKRKIGLLPVIVQERVGLGKALAGGVEYTGHIIKLIVVFLGKIFTREAPADFGGPVRVVVEIGNAAKLGLFSLFQLTAFLSINLGFFNLLPIPALDGARIGFLLWEGVTRAPVDPEKENIVHLVGFTLLILLMVAVTYHDIIQLSGGIQ
ncbi:MAG: RIP metalloprotease RseP [Ammonifex sp.]|jgi:regulator of sigma E protease|nr:MAG: RIP metalloprotease RseP [Ammonifex sp.]